MLKYIKFFKPYQVLCQFTDAAKRQTLKDFIPVTDVYPAGRLDYRSEGLLLLTNDGPLIQRLTDPRFEHAKTYCVQVEGVLPVEIIQILQGQMILAGIQTKLAKAEIIPDPHLPPRPIPVRNYHQTTWLKITLREGKKHQIRRMTAAVGFPALRLVRISIGCLTLDDLQPGQWLKLTPTEIQSLNTYPR
jgi:23S rRNA pseudouridine2457 synthase